MNFEKVLPNFLRKRLARERMCVDDFVLLASRETSANALMLDAGAGECQYKKHFNHVQYHAVDFALGKETWDYSNLDVTANLLKLPFKNDTFDVILCTQVLEHINLPQELIRELYRVLKPEGSLYLTAPQGFKEHQAPYDFYRYTSYGLRFLFEQAGFKIEYISPMGGYFYFLADRISPFHRYLFNKNRPIYIKLIFLPLEPISKILFSIILPLLIGSLDFLDKKQKWTVGYKCKVSK